MPHSGWAQERRQPPPRLRGRTYELVIRRKAAPGSNRDRTGIEPAWSLEAFNPTAMLATQR